MSKSVIEHSVEVLNDVKGAFSSLLISWFGIILKALGLYEDELLSHPELVLDKVSLSLVLIAIHLLPLNYWLIQSIWRL